jgi:monofunctional glycosyltransferase
MTLAGMPANPSSSHWKARLLHAAGLLLLCLLALQLCFVMRVALMAVVDPQSTSFQRSEAWRLLMARSGTGWSHEWVDDKAVSPHLLRAVVASEDAGYFEHDGFEWEAIDRAFQRNRRAQQSTQSTASPSNAGNKRRAGVPKIVGGSTISQQLAKNLLLSAERTWLRKAQEGVVTVALEALLSKERMLTIYLNSVEWGEGVFGAQAAARHYFKVDAAQLSLAQAARLAVMLPAPKRFEQQPASPYLRQRAATIQARMHEVELP